MSTTTIRLPDDLRARVETVATATGTSMHAFMLQAISEVTERVERRQDFHSEAELRWKKMLQTGEYLTHGDLGDYALALARGEDPKVPQPRRMSTGELARLRASARRMGDD
jgi:predicted transcriptional regulator